MSDIIVIGSINADQVVIANRMPKKGETITGEQYLLIPGGKGANQAVAAARLEKEVTMIGCVGEDYLGKFLLEELNKNGVDTTPIRKTQDTSTGIAQITVAEEDNSIIVVPGANGAVTIEAVKANIELLKTAKIVVLQLEIPLETVRYAVEVCYQHGIPTILNPAPAIRLEKDLIEKVTYLTPNEHECAIVFGKDKMEEVLKEYPGKVIVTQGEKGVSFYDGKEIINVPAYKNRVVDTTGAGDTFNGALATALTNEKSLYEAIDFANKAASLSIAKMGAQGGMPTLKELNVVFQ